ncbi:MAG: MarR family EPS-associated transcriptional regulator [Nitrospirota bacterium]
MDESQFKTLRELAKDGTQSQRDLSKRMGLSLGRVNYLVNELLRKGFIKAERFKNSKNKAAYKYLITQKGAAVRMTETNHFLQRKLEEYAKLKEEIAVLRRENHNSP